MKFEQHDNFAQSIPFLTPPGSRLPYVEDLETKDELTRFADSVRSLGFLFNLCRKDPSLKRARFEAHGDHRHSRSLLVLEGDGTNGIQFEGTHNVPSERSQSRVEKETIVARPIENGTLEQPRVTVEIERINFQTSVLLKGDEGRELACVTFSEYEGETKNPPIVRMSDSLDEGELHTAIAMLKRLFEAYAAVATERDNLPSSVDDFRNQFGRLLSQ